MLDKKVLEKLNSELNKITEAISLLDLGLLKSTEFHETTTQVHKKLKSLKDEFDKINRLKIEKIIPTWTSAPKSNVFIGEKDLNKKLVLKELHDFLQETIKERTGSEIIDPVSLPEPTTDGGTINDAILDAKILLESRGPSSTVDRIHTLLFSYLKKICDDKKISYEADNKLTDLIKKIKNNHHSFKDIDNHTGDILNGLSNIFDKLNPIRNSKSMAHPNKKLLTDEEAMFVINTVNTIIMYLDSKLNK